MLIENGLIEDVDKVKLAIDRLRAFEPSEGYYLAFSGGKDSQALYHVAIEAGVKFDAHYNFTGIDPPEVVKFIRSNYPDVIFDKYKKSMWGLILYHMGPPSRIQRFCCKELKEHGGEGRICLTGVRNAESVRRKGRRPFEVVTKSYKDKILFNDNDEDRRMFENCTKKGKRVVNPIIDWEDTDVWKFLNDRNIEHCCLYDEGQKRIGCIGCPMGGEKNMLRDFKRFPKHKQAYINTFDKVIELRRLKGKKCTWNTGEELMQWWIYGNPEKDNEYQNELFEE